MKTKDEQKVDAEKIYNISKQIATVIRDASKEFALKAYDEALNAARAVHREIVKPAEAAYDAAMSLAWDIREAAFEEIDNEGETK